MHADTFHPQTNAWVKVFGSMGDSINQHRYKVIDDDGSAAASPFNSNHVTILSADPNTVQDIAAVFASFGVSHVNVLEIPASGWNQLLPSPPAPAGAMAPPLRMGLAQFQDTFSLLLRIIQPASQSAFQAYAAEHPMAVLRVTRSSAAPARTSPLPLYGPPTLISRATPSGTTAVNELSLVAARDYLVNKILSLHAVGYNVQTIPYAQNLLGAEVDYGAICYGLRVQCNGDNRDSRYMATGGTHLFTPAPTVNFVVGANHKATGTAEFSNVVAYNVDGQVGVAGLDDTQYAGSAASWLAGSPYASLAPYLFVARFARTCGGDPYCAEIPATGFPALPDNTPGLFVTRAYVRPDTGVGSAIQPPTLLPPVHVRVVTLPPA